MKPAIETEWTNEAVVLTLTGERNIDQLESGAFGVVEQSLTGGPVLRGPWGSVGGMQSDWARYEAECERLNAAFVHGFMRARFKECQRRGECDARDGENYCRKCGATVVVDRRIETTPAASNSWPRSRSEKPVDICARQAHRWSIPRSDVTTDYREQIARKLATKRWCYYIPLDANVPGKGFRVSIVIEGEPGHLPTGDLDTSRSDHKEPWFWGETYAEAEQTAAEQNALKGLTERDVALIVASSMGAGRRGRRAKGSKR